jgi:hypothetical protein
VSDFNEFADATGVPEWVSWVAQDADGCWWGYEVEPNRSHSGWYENEVGECILLGKDESNPHWIETLSRVG